MAASSISERQVIPLARVTVPIPVRYENAAAFEAHARVLKIRRSLVDLEYNIRRAGALARRYEAEALACAERLKNERATLPAWAVQDIEARRDEARAKVEYQYELITQYEMEQHLYSAALGPETGD